MSCLECVERAEYQTEGVFRLLFICNVKTEKHIHRLVQVLLITTKNVSGRAKQLQSTDHWMFSRGDMIQKKKRLESLDETLSGEFFDVPESGLQDIFRYKCGAFSKLTTVLLLTTHEEAFVKQLKSAL